MLPPSALLPLLFFFFLFFPSLSSASHFHVHSPSHSTPQQYLDPTFPSIALPSSPPSFSLPLLSHSFAYTYNLPPFSSPYSPPSSPFSLSVLRLSASCAGEQYDRIAAVWINGVELLRTSTAQPNGLGIYWSVRKDVSRYAALLRNNGTVSVMLENIVNDVFTGVYHVNVSIDFYLNSESKESVKPADVIIPVSEKEEDTGYWFRIQDGSDVRFTQFDIPLNTYRAVLEIYVSFHGNDEFWYMNPPDSYIQKNNLTTERGNAAFREVFVIVDGYYAGSIVPFPVVFTGGINPLFWAPVVALGAFNLPTYTLELTPFLGILLDGKSHKIGLGVTDAISYWLVDANLHLWLDPNSDFTSGDLVNYHAENTSILRNYCMDSLDGSFKIEAEGDSYFSGWVNSSFGNLTTEVTNNFEFNSSVEFLNNGNDKFVSMNTHQTRVAKTLIIWENSDEVISEETYKTKYPIQVISKTVYEDNNTDPYTLITNLSHVLHEERSLELNNLVYSSYLIDKQEGDGWMLVHDHDVLAGSVCTKQIYEYGDDDLVYRRMVQVKDGVILSDNTTESFSIEHSSS